MTEPNNLNNNPPINTAQDNASQIDSGQYFHEIDAYLYQLGGKIDRIAEQVYQLKNTVKTLKSQQTADMKIEYNLLNDDQNYIKLFIYFIKSINSIYIYILLGDEYEYLYQKIENLLNVDPFQQQKNYEKFDKLIRPYPNITKKTTIQEIFLYKNEEIKEVVEICIGTVEFDGLREFLHSEGCGLLDFYLTDNKNTNIDLKKINETLYLDRFKDEDMTDDYTLTARNFLTFYRHEFPLVEDPRGDSFLPIPENLSTSKKISKKRFRNYEFIYGLRLLPGEIRTYVDRQLRDPCQ